MISALFVVLAALGYGFYIYWAKATFVSREIRTKTGAKQVHVLDEIHTGDHWYGKAEINEQTGRELLGRYSWEHDFEKKRALAGRTVSNKPQDCAACLYRVEVDPHDREYHPYNYTVYVLSPDLKILEVFEQFGSLYHSAKILPMCTTSSSVELAQQQQPAPIVNSYNYTAGIRLVPTYDGPGTQFADRDVSYKIVNAGGSAYTGLTLWVNERLDQQVGGAIQLPDGQWSTASPKSKPNQWNDGLIGLLVCPVFFVPV